MVKEKLLAGGYAYGTMCRTLNDATLPFIAKNAGLDFILMDCEHSKYDMANLHDLFMTCRALGIDGMLRVPFLCKDWISRALDQGAMGVMVPMVETEEQAKEVVHWAKYAPIGDRGLANGIAHCNYQGGNAVEVMKHANDTVLAIAQIETGLAIENIEKIAAVEGIDAMIIGPNDLSCSLGIPGDLYNDIEINAIKKVAAAAKKYGKAFGLHGPAKLQGMFKDDINIRMLNTDTAMIISGMQAIKKTYAEMGM